jgi:hypothetical protein
MAASGRLVPAQDYAGLALLRERLDRCFPAKTLSHISTFK